MKRKIIVGLGNPGLKYQKTWHNLGFMALEVLAQRHSVKIDRLKFKGELGELTLGDYRVTLLRPQTFMNNSGESVQSILHYYQLTPQDIIVVYDDIDLKLGDIRLRERGRAGSHRGMQSIVQHLHSEDFPRLRLGFGPQDRTQDIVDVVLSEVPKAQQKLTFQMLERSCEALETACREGIAAAMCRFNRPQANKEDESPSTSVDRTQS